MSEDAFYRLTALGRSWLHPGQLKLTGAIGELEDSQKAPHQKRRMFYLFFLRHGMGLWLTGAEFERSN